MGYLNGDIMRDGTRYHRMYDFNRDAWHQLADKLSSKTWNKKSRRKYLPTIYDKMLTRLENGSCSKKEVLNLLSFKLFRANKRTKKQIKIYMSEIAAYDIQKERAKKAKSQAKKAKSQAKKSEKSKIEASKIKEYNIVINDSNVFINGDKVKLKGKKKKKSINITFD